MTEASKHSLWVEKYRPETLDEYVFHDPAQRTAVERFIADKSIPHLLLTGVQGSGKSTLAQILIRELDLDDTDVLKINGSDENSVDDIRNKIKGFITTFPLGEFKVVHIEEADYLTPNAQAVMRVLMEDYVDIARFILTCNYENKIIPAIKSRSQHFRFQASDKNEVTEFAAKILIAEKVKFDIDLLDRYVKIAYPDIRKIVNLLHQHSSDGELTPPNTEGSSGDYKFELLNLIDRDDWVKARLLCCDNVLAEEWEGVYAFLYENLSRAPKFQDRDRWENGIVTIADHLYKHSLVADPEINAAAMFIKLGTL